MNTSGRVLSVSLPAASTSELNRQQKQPPGISSVAKPLEAIAVSTALALIVGDQAHRAAGRAQVLASAATLVVLPAPRNPPIMM